MQEANQTHLDLKDKSYSERLRHNMDKLWIRDSSGNPIEIRDVWIRDQGQPRKISDMWVRNSSGIPEKVYPQEAEETTLIVMNQGVEQQLASIRFDQAFPTPFTTWSVGIDSSYRNEGVKFGLNEGVGSSGSSGTLNSAAQTSLTPLIAAFNGGYSKHNSANYSFDWDWGISINIENLTAINAITRGGKNADVIVPLDYVFFNRNSINNATQQVINTVLNYYSSETQNTITYHQLHDSCLRANQDTATWLSQQAPTAKIMNWWKASVSPIPLIGTGWWNNNNPVALDGDGTPPNGLDYDYQQAVAGLRTINGDQLYTVSGTSVVLPDPLTPWSYGLKSYPYGTYQSRAYSVPFESTSNSNEIQNGVDVVVHQSYYPVYPIDRTLNTIPFREFTTITAPDLTHGFTSDGGRYTRYPQALLAAKQSNRVSWLANWKTFGNKASIGTELNMDLGGFQYNRFNGLAYDKNTDEKQWTYKEAVIDAVLDPLTEEESLLFGISSEFINKRLIPQYWVFWNATYFYLSRLMTLSNGLEGRGEFRTNTNALYRSRSNIEWRFAGMAGAPQIDWLEGSQWHGFICRQFDLFGIQRCQWVKEAIEVARSQNN
jgi:hypothetical protein